MDFYQSLTPSTKISTGPQPAMLWVGSHESLSDEAELFLQQQFCTKNGCGICKNCMHVRDRQHHAVTWINPEKGYTTETLSPVFESIAFALDAGQQHFFILQKAELLTLTCANSLLKSVEEPPAGYQFIFLTQNLDAILPTIRSRCTIKHFKTTNETIPHEALFEQFTSITDNPLQFFKILDQSKITEAESVELLNKLLKFWIKTTQAQPNTQEKQIICSIEHTLLNPPMPGGSKIMWRNLYLQTRS